MYANQQGTDPVTYNTNHLEGREDEDISGGRHLPEILWANMVLCPTVVGCFTSSKALGV